MITIYDIAKKTGYTAPSISKALNGTGGLSDKTRKKILEAATELGYKPNMAARALTTRKTNLIGVIFEDSDMGRGFEHPLFGGLLNKFRAQVERAGYDIIFLSKNFGNKINAYAEHAEYRDVDGVLILNPDSPAEAFCEIAKRGIPCVSTNDFVPGICTIVSENIKTGTQAVAYLISKGHRNIGYLGASSSESSRASTERQQGYEKALKDANIPINTSYIKTCNAWHIEAGYEGAKDLLSKNKNLTAVFCANDTIAFGLMRYCNECNISIPDELSVIGFDDDRVASYIRPALTTFRQNRETIAELAADTLLQAISGVPTPEIIRVPTTMLVRESVKDIT